MTIIAPSATSFDDHPPNHYSLESFLPIVKKTLTIFLPLFLLVLGAIATVYWSEVRNRRLSIKEDEKASVVMGKRIILDTLSPALADLRYLSKAVTGNNLLATSASAAVRKDLEAQFVDFSMTHGVYDQIRVIDATGMEIVRVNYNGGEPAAVNDAALQMKKHRYYFPEAMQLARDQIYVSPLDLNIEHGAVEIPFKPMIRLATPVLSATAKIIGIVIINYTAQNLLDNFSGAAKHDDSHLMLLNVDGYWLRGSAREDEWGFMFPQGGDLTFGNRFPTVWEAIQSRRIGQLSTDQGLFTFCTVFPLLDCPEWRICMPPTAEFSNQSYSWIIVSHRPAKNILVEKGALLIKALAASAVAFCVLMFLSYRLAIVGLHRRQVEVQLRKAKENLEQIVIQRTGELQATNQELRLQIDERAKVENALRKSEGQYRTLVETMREGIWVIDQKDRFAFVNRQFCTMLEYSPEEIVGYEYGDFLDPVNLKKLNKQLAKRRLGMSAPFELQWVKKSGAPLLTYVSPSTLYDENQQFHGSLAVVTDITQQKRSESEKVHLELQLLQAQKMEAIGVLSGGIAHDFNNILMPIMGYAELIKDSLPENDAIHGFIHPILEGSQRAKELVAQILSFSRQSNNERQPTLIAPLVNEPLKLIKASLPSNIEIASRIQAKDAMIMANPVQIHQLVMNLCTNAYHAMEQTGGKLSVSLSVQGPVADDGGTLPPDAATHACLTVSDTGTGIAPEALSRIFEPYFTTKAQDKGTGLGLSVVHGIVAACKGEIRVQSRLGKGTTFSVLLPLITTPSESVSIDLPTELDGGGEAILLVDDEEPIARLEKSILERLGYTVTARISSLDALDTFRSDPYRFDLVITDLTMPNLIGLELAEKIIAIRADIPILMLTGFSEHLNTGSLKKAGIRQVIMKPALAKDLAKAIRRVLDEGDPARF
jgi:PAS domain S-box-containing protein